MDGENANDTDPPLIFELGHLTCLKQIQLTSIIVLGEYVSGGEEIKYKYAFLTSACYLNKQWQYQNVHDREAISHVWR